MTKERQGDPREESSTTSFFPTMMVINVEQATRIIDALTSTDYQAQQDKQGIQKKGLLELNILDDLLARNKILT